MKKHKVELTPEERQTLETLVRKGQHSALKLMRDLAEGGRGSRCMSRTMFARWAAVSPPFSWHGHEAYLC